MRKRANREKERSWAEIWCLGCLWLQLSWPGVLLKKWLNIKNTESDFSADEHDSDSDSDWEDEGDWNREETTSEIKRDGGFRCQSMRNPSGILTCRMRRRKSETLRVQYIEAKELRICISTWNVGGEIPPDDLDIDEWLDMDEPADLYVLGLQEVVPLNAGNVLGTEDNHPVSKWENLIRRTLDKCQTEKPKVKCYSDPPSPSRFKPSEDVPSIEDETSSDNDTHDEAAGIPEGPFSFQVNVDGHPQSVYESSNVDNSMQTTSTDVDALQGPHQQVAKRLDRLHQLSGKLYNTVPEPGTSDTSQVKILTRTYSSLEKIGLIWPETPFDLLDEHALQKHRSFKACTSFRASSSFNLSRFGNYNEVQREESIPIARLEPFGYRRRRSTYARIVSKQMVGIFLSVWVRRKLRRFIRNVKVSTVGVGVLGFIGNKGSVSVSMSIYQTLFCFVCSHLTAGEKDGDELRRNSDVQEIMRRTKFNHVPSIGLPKTILDHERIIWFGDLNYRINLSYEKTRELISKKAWSTLIEKDQLTKEMWKGHAFSGWKEALLSFPPTFKYELNSDSYTSDEMKSGRRIPAWCDRILSFGKGLQQISYKRVEQRLSDHRPVTATFIAEVEVFSHKKLQRALTFTDAELNEDDLLGEIELDSGPSQNIVFGECSFHP